MARRESDMLRDCLEALRAQKLHIKHEKLVAEITAHLAGRGGVEEVRQKITPTESTVSRESANEPERKIASEIASGFVPPAAKPEAPPAAKPEVSPAAKSLQPAFPAKIAIKPAESEKAGKTA